jgi:hypothetical protein
MLTDFRCAFFRNILSIFIGQIFNLDIENGGVGTFSDSVHLQYLPAFNGKRTAAHDGCPWRHMRDYGFTIQNIA